MMVQLALPLEPREAFARENFVVGTTNADALAFVESWPGWRISAAVIHGPSGAGKSHLAVIWQRLSGARLLSMADIAFDLPPEGPLVIEDVDSASGEESGASALFLALERAKPSAPVLLTGREPPSLWPCALPDLASRFSALPDFRLRLPDDALLSGIARKLFADRQLTVPDSAVDRMLHSLERSPSAIRAFVQEVDRRALAESRPVTPALIRELLTERDKRLS
jgi:chromosomal replication initiation ATPase DnaA